MSIDEVISAAYLYGQSRRFESEERSDKRMSTLRAAIDQHVAEAVARERGECARIAEWYIGGKERNYSAVIAEEIRARAEKEAT